MALRLLLRHVLRSAVAAALVPAALLAQASPTVPPNDPVYAFIDRLVAARLVDTVIAGQRAMSRRAVGRIIAEARRRTDTTSWMANRLREYATWFPDGPRALLVTGMRGDATFMDSPSRGIEPDGNGSIDVALNPLASNQLGRKLANGQTFAHEVYAATTPASWLAIGASSRRVWKRERGGDFDETFELDQLYGRTVWRNVALLVGRDPLFLGQGNAAGLIGSLDARPADQLRLSSDRPFVLPGLLRLAGPIHGTIALADLGAGQRFPHGRLLSYKLSSRPHPRFEIGAGLAEQVGGRGSPGGTFLQKAGDAFPLLDALFLHRAFLFSNKFVLVDLRYTIPGMAGTQFYAEGAFDDFDLRRTRSVFTEDAAYIWGVSKSCFRECGRVRASVEYHVTGLRYYTHTVFSDGFTVDRQFIGDPLGPRGRGAYASVDALGERLGMIFDAAYEDRNGNQYGATTTTPDDSDFRFVVLGRRPAERRWRATATSAVGGATARTRYTLTLGAERVENFGHADGAWRTNWIGRVAIDHRLTPRSR